jgi:hypothetical protein
MITESTSELSAPNLMTAFAASVYSHWSRYRRAQSARNEVGVHVASSALTGAMKMSHSPSATAAA